MKKKSLLKYIVTIFCCSLTCSTVSAHVIDVYPEYYEEDGGVIVIDEWDEDEEEETHRPEPTTEEDIPSFTWEEVPEESPPVVTETVTEPPAETLPPETEPPTTAAPTTEAPTTAAPATEAQTTAAPTTAEQTAQATTAETATTQESITEAPTNTTETQPQETYETETAEGPTTETKETATETLPAETTEAVTSSPETSEAETETSGKITIVGTRPDENIPQEDLDKIQPIAVKISVVEGTALPIVVTLENVNHIQTKYAINESEQNILIKPGTYIVAKVVDGRNKTLKSGMSFTVTSKTKELVFDFKRKDESLKDRIITFFVTNAWVLVMGLILFLGFVAYRKIFYDEEGE